MIEKENVLWQVAQQMMANLQANTTKLADVSAEKMQEFAAGNGVFAVFYGGRELGLGIGKDVQADMLYVDTASQILRHLHAENTGDTGLRRSLAALLAVKYDLQAKPRSNDADDVDRYDNYALTEESEAKLTEWMKENLSVGMVTAPADSEDQLISAMIAGAAPVLNLTNNNNNQYGAEVKRCRKQLAAAAAAWQG